MTIAPGIRNALLLLAAAGAPLQAQAAADSARSLFTARVRAAGIPGAQLVVLVQGRVALSVAYGFADSAGQVAVTDTTLFRAGSISKLATATAAARLWEAGRLDLDAPVERLVPEFAGKSSVTPGPEWDSDGESAATRPGGQSIIMGAPLPEAGQC